MNNPVSLNVANFFETYITDPSSKDLKPKDQAIAWVATIVLGVLTLGIAQLASYALRGRVSKDHVSNDAEKKTANVGEEVLSSTRFVGVMPSAQNDDFETPINVGGQFLSSAPSGTIPSTQNNDLEAPFPELKNPEVKESLDQLLKNDKLKTLSDDYLKFLSKFPESGIEYKDSDWNRWIAEEEKLGGSIIKTLYGDLTNAKAKSEKQLKSLNEQIEEILKKDSDEDADLLSDEEMEKINKLRDDIGPLEEKLRNVKSGLSRPNEFPSFAFPKYIADKHQFMFDDKGSLHFIAGVKDEYPTTPFISLNLYLAARKG